MLTLRELAPVHCNRLPSSTFPLPLPLPLPSSLPSSPISRKEDKIKCPRLTDGRRPVHL